MTTAMAPSRADEREISAGTTMRFALLVILLMVSSGAMMSTFTDQHYQSDGYGGFGCELAAGFDPPFGGESPGVSSVWLPLRACLARYDPSPPWWLTFAWPVLVMCAAAGLFWILPVWKARSRRLVPLKTVDRDGVIRQTLDDLADVAGLAPIQRIFVDPTENSVGAVVFGSNRRPTLCLYAGLLARRSENPTGFRGVLLHELAHVRNGDVTLTYTAVSVWRVFVPLVLAPYLVWYLVEIPTWSGDQYFSAQAPFWARTLTLPLVLTILVYLARSDVLRIREVYADLASSPHEWEVNTACQPNSRLRRVLASFAALWHVHPRWDFRLRALADPAPLFHVMALPMFLTGAAAVLIDAQASSYLGSDLADGTWADGAQSVLPAIVVSGVAGIAIWRSAAHAALTGRHAPSGLRAGLWLGAGMAVGVLVTGQAMFETAWLPDHPEVLGVVVVAGALFIWWIAQCSHAWALSGHAKRQHMLVITAAACLLSTAWFAWWQVDGTSLAGGPGGAPSITAASRTLVKVFGGPAAAHHAMLYVIGVWFQVFSGVDDPLALAAISVLVVVPLLAWAVHPASEIGPCEAEAAYETRNPSPLRMALPPLRDILLASAAGGAICWVAVALAKVYMHTWQPPEGQRGGLYAFLLSAWVVACVVAVSTATGAITSAKIGYYRLLITLIVAEVSALIGLLGYFLLMSYDGCIQPMSTLASRCHWVPTGGWSLLTVVLGPVLGSTALLAAVTALFVSAVYRIRETGQQHDASVHLLGQRRVYLLVRRACVGLTCSAIAVSATTAATTESGSWNGQISAITASWDPHRGQSPSGEMSRLQMAAWLNFGGRDLFMHYERANANFTKILGQIASSDGEIRPSIVGPLCSSMGQIAQQASLYFPIPDPKAENLWDTFIRRSKSASKGCLLSIRQDDPKAFTTSLNEFISAGTSIAATEGRIAIVRSAQQSLAFT